MRDMNMEMGGEYARLDSVLFGRQLRGWIAECAGGCGRLVLDDQFCRDCMMLNRQMEAKRLGGPERATYVAQMRRLDEGRVDAGIADYDAEGEDRLRVTDNPLAMLGIGLAVTVGGFAAFWYGIPLLVGFGLWLSGHGI